jgi:hypothetical protein
MVGTKLHGDVLTLPPHATVLWVGDRECSPVDDTWGPTDPRPDVHPPAGCRLADHPACDGRAVDWRSIDDATEQGTYRRVGHGARVAAWLAAQGSRGAILCFSNKMMACNDAVRPRAAIRKRAAWRLPRLPQNAYRRCVARSVACCGSTADRLEDGRRAVQAGHVRGWRLARCLGYCGQGLRRHGRARAVGTARP